jgi:RNA polymerase sigma-70 factor (ECF subfamily)
MDATCELSKTSGTDTVSSRQRLDETLLESIAAGDRFAMQVLFQRHNVRIYRFVLRLTGNAAAAEEIVSEVFLEVWRQAATFQAKCQATTWLLTIARHKAISALRRRRQKRWRLRAWLTTIR